VSSNPVRGEVYSIQHHVYQVCPGYWRSHTFLLKHRLLCYSKIRNIRIFHFCYDSFSLLSKSALLTYLNISISTLIVPWNSLLDKLDICIFLLTYFMYYIQVINYLFIAINILSTTFYSRHVALFIYFFTCATCDWYERNTRFQILILIIFFF